MDLETPPTRIPWKPIEPLEAQDHDRLSNGSLAALDALRHEWLKYLNGLLEADRVAIRQRTLRRLSIETGILERLYDIDWGLTLSLVAEGFARDVVERAGGTLDDRVIATLRAQMETLGLVLDFVRDNRALTPGFIKELHSSITRTQTTYTVVDALGRTTETSLPHGVWKTAPNHVVRSNNTILEYAPPEQVASEIDRLVEMFDELQTRNAHPLIAAAWLHHRFVQIHPFADGNGRVARALTVLVLEKHRYAPLVIDRFHRGDYIAALEAANAGSLTDLVKLFVRLENSALAGELEKPEPRLGHGLSLDVAHTLAEQLKAQQQRRSLQIQDAARTRAVAVRGRVRHWFERKRTDLEKVFRQQQIERVRIHHDSEEPGGSRSAYFKTDIISAARAAGHFANLTVIAGWSRLKVKLDGVELWFVASLHEVGKTGGGILAVTTFGQFRAPRDGSAGGDDGDTLEISHIETTKDAFRFVHTESLDALTGRAAELEALLDEGLTEALSRLLKEI